MTRKFNSNISYHQFSQSYPKWILADLFLFKGKWFLNFPCSRVENIFRCRSKKMIVHPRGWVLMLVGKTKEAKLTMLFQRPTFCIPYILRTTHISQKAETNLWITYFPLPFRWSQTIITVIFRSAKHCGVVKIVWKVAFYRQRQAQRRLNWRDYILLS